MAVAVLSCGRTGTNMILEILRGSPELAATHSPQNQHLCSRPKKHPKNYLTKCETVYFEENQLQKMMDMNPHMKIIWAIRDPRDIVLSMFKRGQPGEDVKKLDPVATPKGCLAVLNKMSRIYMFAADKYKDQLLLVKMEDVLRDVEAETKRMCDFIGISYHDEMIDFMPRMRNRYKKKRYKNLDQGQLELWKRRDEIYDGFFADGKYDLDDMFQKVKPLIRLFDYEETT